MKKLSLIIFACFITLTAAPAFCSNFSFLYNSPIKYLTKADWTIVENLSEKVLDSYPNNKKAEWSNPQSGNSGYLEALNTNMQKNIKCRNLKFYSHTKHGGSSAATFQFCHYADGWKTL